VADHLALVATFGAGPLASGDLDEVVAALELLGQGLLDRLALGLGLEGLEPRGLDRGLGSLLQQLLLLLGLRIVDLGVDDLALRETVEQQPQLAMVVVP
jgi:hypothetical protein